MTPKRAEGPILPYSKRSAMRLLRFFIPAFILGAGFWPTDAAAIELRGPRLYIEEKIFDFGKVNAGEVLQHDFVVSNKGDAPLEIGSVKPDG
jgi:hypothetical protein